jgi:hypothetical protein
MKRKILFRGKYIGNQKTWLYGYYHCDKQTLSHYICEHGSLRKYEIMPETVGQLVLEAECEHNHTGQDIYEGDILLCYGVRKVVEWGIYDDEQGYSIDLDCTDLEIIGNIHD